VTADGTYDSEPTYWTVSERQPDPPVAVIIPPRWTAVPSVAAGTTPSQRDRHTQMIPDEGRMAWQKANGYGRRSHADTAMFRYKALIGSSLGARTLPAQKTEAKVGCSVLNRMARLGAPVSQRVRMKTPWARVLRPQSQLCTKAHRAPMFFFPLFHCEAGHQML